MKPTKKNVSGMVAVLLTLFFAPVVYADVINPTISDENNTVNIAYDRLNRIINKTSTDQNISYAYDNQYLGTVTNITARTFNISYEYDDRLRLTKEIRVIDGIQFVKRYLYDSENKLLSVEVHAEDIDYIYNSQGKVQSIPNYLTTAHYNAFGSVINRTAANSLVTSYTYDSNNNRLSRILIPSVQDLNYAYDAVGNIKSINDALGTYDHVMSYDALDRLTTATVGPHRYVYSYNPIGNIMKIVDNDASKKFIYNGNAHFPSQIIEGSAGVDVHKVSQNETNNKTRRVTFFLVNDKNESLAGVNWTVQFADGNTASNSGLSVTNSLFVEADNVYSNAGSYNVNVSARSPNITDSEILDIGFGLEAQSLNRIYNRTSTHIFEFITQNELDVLVQNLTWKCLGVQANAPVNLTGNKSLFVYVQYNATPGDLVTNCSITSLDGNAELTDVFPVKSLSIENYSVTAHNASRRVISYQVRNEYDNLTATIKIITDAETVTTTQSIATGAAVTVTNEVVYSTDGNDAFVINVSSGAASAQYSDLFTVEGSTLLNYSRINYGTIKEFVFYVKNNWLGGTTSWGIGTHGNSTTLNFNNSQLVSKSQNYSTQGRTTVNVTAQRDAFVDKIIDRFENLPVQITSLSVLGQGQQRAVFEGVVQNNLNTTQGISWILRSGEANVSSTQNMTITNNAFVFVETNYTSSGVYQTDFVANSSLFRDNQTGVVVS